MREKEQRTIITFHTTAEAMAAEKVFKNQGTAGRLIPVPRQISAGCGLAWSSPAEVGSILEELLKKQGLDFESIGDYRV